MQNIFKKGVRAKEMVFSFSTVWGVEQRQGKNFALLRKVSEKGNILEEEFSNICTAPLCATSPPLQSKLPTKNFNISFPRRTLPVTSVLQKTTFLTKTRI